MPPPLQQDRGARRVVYYHHLRKCGGTSMGRWLDQQVHDSRRWRPDLLGELQSWFDGNRTDLPPAEIAQLLRRLGPAAFHWADVVHSHVPIGAYAPAAAFRFTALRQPIARLVSQVADWRRLTQADRASVAPDLRRCLEDATHMRLRPWLELHGHGAARQRLDNYMVRALAPIAPGAPPTDAAALLPGAQAALLHDYDLVGTAEAAAQLRLLVCARLGWAPAAGAGPILNRTGSADTMRAETEEAMPLLRDLTRHDAALYEQAQRQFGSAWAAHAGYDAAAFEAASAATRLQALRGSRRGGMVTYSVRQPLIGDGFHGRDGAGTPRCAVWTGPAPAAQIYIPAPPSTRIRLALWIRGYADEAQRTALRLRADGTEVAHRFEPAEGYRDLLVTEVQTTRDFVRLEIDVGRTMALGAPGEAIHDPRERGLSFDRYGWLPI